jgi:ankyrin repeat protein
VLQLQLVLNQVTKSGVRKVLRGISTELDQLFGDTLVRIERHNPELREIALSTLMWLSCARRPLSTCELQHAVAIRIDEAQIDPDEDCPPLEVIVESCLGLVTIEHDEATVRLCHYSLQEYLERQRDSLFPQAQTTIPGVCLTYLSYELPEVALIGRRTKREGIPVQVILEHLPFLQYAVEHWGYHAKEAPFHAIKELALKFAMDFHKTIRAARILVRHAPSLEHRYRFEYCRAGGDEARPEALEEKLRKFACGLHFAARLDWPELLECLLEKGSKVNGTDMFDNNNTALHIVASRGNLQCVNIVLNREAKVDRYNLGFYTPLFLAASGGHAQVAHALIKRKASVNLKGADGWTALHKAVDLGHVDMVRLLLSHGAWIAAKTARELCPLHRACGRGHYEVMRLLLDHGAPVEATTEDGWTALHGAARSGRKEVVEILLQHSSDLNCQTTEGRTPLHHACRGGHDEIVLLLMAHGADPLVKDRHGQYPVHRAAKGDNPRVLEILLSSGLDQLSERDNFNATPLDVAQSTGSFAAADFLRHAMSSELGLEDTKAALELAIEGGDAELIKVLLDEGADPNSMGPRVWTALEQALQHDREEIATLLLQAGADVDAIGTRGWRALHVAARKGNANTVKLCLDHGADIKSVTEGQQTALHLACYSGDEATIRQLIDRGSDIEATDGRLTRPGHIAASNGHGGALRLLVEKGISLEARAGKSRRTIQSCAAQGSHFALVEFLRERRLNSSEVNDYY